MKHNPAHLVDELDHLVRIRERFSMGETKVNATTQRLDKLINIILDKLETIHG